MRVLICYFTVQRFRQRRTSSGASALVRVPAQRYNCGARTLPSGFALSDVAVDVRPKLGTV